MNAVLLHVKVKPEIILELNGNGKPFSNRRFFKRIR